MIKDHMLQAGRDRWGPPSGDQAAAESGKDDLRLPGGDHTVAGDYHGRVGTIERGPRCS